MIGIQERASGADDGDNYFRIGAYEAELYANALAVHELPQNTRVMTHENLQSKKIYFAPPLGNLTTRQLYPRI